MSTHASEANWILESEAMKEKIKKAATPIARAALRETDQFRILSGGGGAMDWLLKGAPALAEDIEGAIHDAISDWIMHGKHMRSSP